jgi:hypothetical protein
MGEWMYRSAKGFVEQWLNLLERNYALSELPSNLILLLTFVLVSSRVLKTPLKQTPL